MNFGEVHGLSSCLIAEGRRLRTVWQVDGGFQDTFTRRLETKSGATRMSRNMYAQESAAPWLQGLASHPALCCMLSGECCGETPGLD